MDQREFWKLIDDARLASGGDDERLVAHLEDSLAALEPAAVIRFAEFYEEHRRRAYRRPLWGAADLINGGCSDDGFEYFRGWLISRGERVYEAALADPDTLAPFVNGDDLELEALLYAPLRAYERRTGESMPRAKWPVQPLMGNDWTEEDLDSLFPRIAKHLEPT